MWVFEQPHSHTCVPLAEQAKVFQELLFPTMKASDKSFKHLMAKFSHCKLMRVGVTIHFSFIGWYSGLNEKENKKKGIFVIYKIVAIK